ncbi:MAG TPA: uroporphyrinogen-III C-methyltransferase, partial [Beijerinckiaceae bacterium]|nr:uroporphyrinogen-III C-methyltransferase [Beijerinckiaceae bacterium]
AETPAVAVYNATRADQHVEGGTAATLAAQVAQTTAAGPAIVLVGQTLAEVVPSATTQDAAVRRRARA